MKDKKQLALIVLIIVILLLSFTVGGTGKYVMDFMHYANEDISEESIETGSLDDGDLADYFEDTYTGNHIVDENVQALQDLQEAQKAQQTGDIVEPEEQNVSEANDFGKDSAPQYIEYRFRNAKLKNQHYEKHGIEMGFASADAYEIAAADVANSREALHKLEAEDGDDVYYIERTNEFVIVSKDGYLRTYFNPSRGIDYYNRQ